MLRPSGQWSVPLLLGILDDHSRLCCHAQWYLAEGAEELCHGLSQAFQKRGLPRSLLEDNGSAMIAAETEQGLVRLSIVAEHTLPFSPYQNGKQESFWGQIEGRLLPMLEGVADLSLDQLNEATLAWIEMEYNRKVHSETGADALAALPPRQGCRPALSGHRATAPGVHRRSHPHPAAQRRLLQPGGPSLRGALPLRALSQADRALCLLGSVLRPSGRSHHRRHSLPALSPGQKPECRGPPRSAPARVARQSRQRRPGWPRLLQQLLRQYAATGLPPAYLPKPENPA